MASEKKKKSRPGKHQRQYYKAKKAREARAKWHEAENNVFPNTGTDPNGKPMESTEGHQSPQSDKVAAPHQRIEEAVPHDREYRPEPEPQKKTGRNKKSQKKRLHHFTVHHGEQMIRRQHLNERSIRLIWKTTDENHSMSENKHKEIKERAAVIEKHFNLAVEQGSLMQRDIKKLQETINTMQQDIDTMRQVTEGQGAEIAELKSKLAAALSRQAGSADEHTGDIQLGRMEDCYKIARDEIQALQHGHEEMKAEMAAMKEQMSARFEDTGRKRIRSDEADETEGGPQKKAKGLGSGETGGGSQDQGSKPKTEATWSPTRLREGRKTTAYY
ncbi:hypothetical protein CFIO01_01845 [Colletotrichum fioriniae PJ7]|uniref:Uncharacterized protein n=1 Tax=Colletotrichum fioriniae PJ7 TaxID=1445577 RepID=A0A010R0W0_9PEZI|nr:hypothetical protein CFIO01_01845 [Colletotrichum fioriniae PJ7]